MGRKNGLNPMEAYRRKQKKQQLAKNKKKRLEAKEKALKKRSPEWIMNEVQKINRRERQEHGKNAEKNANRRKKLMDAYDQAVRIQKIKEKAQQRNKINSNDNNDNHQSSPTPPPIEQMENNKNDNNEDIDMKQNNDKLIQQNTAINNANIYNPLYRNPLLMNPYNIASMYSDTLGAKSITNINTNIPPPPPYPVHPLYGQQPMYHQPINPYYNKPNVDNKNILKHHEPQQRIARDKYDPLNPANPKYNFIHQDNKYQHQAPQSNINPATSPPLMKPQAPMKPMQTIKEHKNKKRKREIEVIMDPKLKSMMPSSLRFKRKFEQPKIVRPAKKRKLDIAPEVDKDNNNNKKNKNNTNNNSTSFNSASNADAAYDKFMDEISGLL